MQSRRCWVHFCSTWFLILSASVGPYALADDSAEPLWRRHVIDQSSRGADGTRSADANGDGLLDIVTGWEQGGITRVYLHPGYERVRKTWPAVTVGTTPSVEDAVLVDLDGDGAMDVVSSCEGKRQAMFVHWAPTDGYLDASAWKTVPIPASVNKTRWMFACPMDVDGDGQLDVVAAGKGDESELGWWKVPKNPRDMDDWQWRTLRKPLGWIMTIQATDIDGDNDLDLLFTDRKGPKSGCFWLEHPGRQRVAEPWIEHPIAATGREAMFLWTGDLSDHDLDEVIVSVRPRTILFCQPQDSHGIDWTSRAITIPETFGSAKHAAAADLDADGLSEIVFTTERATDGKFGIGVIRQPLGRQPSFTTISGVDGVKHDLVELIDLDGDGDLDVLTCEETKNLGVIWYENPHTDAN